MRVLVTGGAGFIGSMLIRHLIDNTSYSIINIDKLSYAGNLDSLSGIENSKRYSFERVDICNRNDLQRIFKNYNPQAVMHLAAESHVDRSIDEPSPFLQTNFFGTFSLLEETRRYIDTLSNIEKSNFRFHHISTDEVFGDLSNSDCKFTEESSYDPSSPYSASKASSDHLVRAWGRTYGIPFLVTNCSNNYGPYQFPEKFIPHMILRAMQGKSLPLYGDGNQIRDWLYVEDHVKALVEVINNGRLGETYNIGGNNEKTNFEVVNLICDLLEEFAPNKPINISHYSELITFVNDRPGHDRRYAIDSAKINRELGWKPEETFESGLRKTVEWYLKNDHWWKRVISGEYRLERVGE